jgi:four helix bundle protein
MKHQNNQSTFIAFNHSLAVIRLLGPLLKRIEQHDRPLGKQLRAAASSVSLNLSEGRRHTGGNRRHLWQVAFGSLEESSACLHVAVAWGYLPDGAADEALALMDQLKAICWRLTGR